MLCRTVSSRHVSFAHRSAHVVRVVPRAVRVLFCTVSGVVTRRVRASRVPFTRVACLAARR
jgi:hypothetical protein